MKTKVDPHDAYKADIETSMIRAAEDKADEVAKYQGIGRAAYEAYWKHRRDNYGFFGNAWDDVAEHMQCAWVGARKSRCDGG